MLNEARGYREEEVVLANVDGGNQGAEALLTIGVAE